MRLPRSFRRQVLALAASLAAPALAATVELQGTLPPQPPREGGPVLPAVPPAAVAAPAAAGVMVELQAVSFEGATLLDEATLQAAVGDVRGRRYDIAGLEALAARVVAAYRQQGWPFVRATLPPQTLGLAPATLRIEVLEGRYGRVQVQGPDPLTPAAQPFLDALLKPGAPIRDTVLERAMLLLDDQPGFDLNPLLRPGAGRGEGDLIVELRRVQGLVADLGVDNAGNRSTGQWRTRAGLTWMSPWRFGDRIAINGLVTNRQMRLGALDYDTPLDAQGLRGQLSASRTGYQLSGAFAPLGASGTADTLGLRLAQAAVRSQRANVQLGLAWQRKRLHDRFEAAGLTRDKTAQLVSGQAQFDLRDGVLGGGVTYGSASVTVGRLAMDDDARVVDALGPRSAGHWDKANLDVARIQRLGGPLSAYGRVSAQWTRGNLDSSEKMGLGGFLGVRAYPMGEGNGDRGWLGQFELRWDLQVATAFAFADQGRTRANARPWDTAAAGVRELAGAGLGLRGAWRGFVLESTLATPTRGGPATAETGRRDPRWFVSLSQRFE